MSRRFCDRRSSWAWLATLLALLGCGDGTVPAKGKLLIDGQPVGSGRLLLTKVGGGEQAFSLVDDQGQFALRAAGNSLGAFPGEYRITFHRPLDAAKLGRDAQQLKGEISVNDLTESFRGPRDKPLVIPSAGDESLVVDIRRSDGWTRTLNE